MGDERWVVISIRSSKDGVVVSRAGREPGLQKGGRGCAKAQGVVARETGCG